MPKKIVFSNDKKCTKKEIYGCSDKKQRKKIDTAISELINYGIIKFSNEKYSYVYGINFSQYLTKDMILDDVDFRNTVKNNMPDNSSLAKKVLIMCSYCKKNKKKALCSKWLLK